MYAAETMKQRYMRYLKTEKKKIEYVSYLYMIFLGASFPAIGVVIGDIAKALGVDVSSAVASYSFFTLSSAVMVFATTGLVLEFVSLKTTNILTSILLFIGIGIILISTNIHIFYIALFVYGIGYGMCFSLGYYLIIYITDNKERASKMALVSLVYAIGATTAPKIFNYMLDELKFSWNITLSSVILFIVLAFILCLFTNFEAPKKVSVSTSKKTRPKHLEVRRTWLDELVNWPVTVYLMSFSLMFYVIAETIVIFWLPIFGQKEIGMTASVGSYLISTFWGFVIIGRFSATFILKKISQETYICFICTLSGILLFLMAVLNISIIWAFLFTAVTGMCFAAAYSTIATTGTTQVPHATSRLTTAVLGSGAVGTVIAPLASSYIKATVGLKLVFISGAVFMLLITAFLILVILVNKLKGYNPQAIHEEE
ncbi:MAG: MFS transporter [Victivallales bacterium]|nr:MFS transporter [Victivallales bacterium]MCF7889070.1 MFS transporter [Victivallales bacterium]